MSVGMSLLTGFLQGTVEKQKEKALLDQARIQKEGELQKEAGANFFKAVESGFDPNSPFVQNLGLQAGFDMNNLVLNFEESEDTTVFGRGKNSISFKFNNAGENIKESSGRNLRDFQGVFSSPEQYENYMEQMIGNTDAAEQYLGSVNRDLIQFGRNFFLTSSIKDDSTGKIGTPVHTDFSDFEDVLRFNEDLTERLGLGEGTKEMAIITSAISASTKNKGLGDNQIFIRTNTQEGQFAGEVYDLSVGDAGIKEKQFLKQLAISRGYKDENHMLYNMADITNGSDFAANLNTLLTHTKTLSEAGAIDLLGTSTRDKKVEVATILKDVAPSGDTALMLNAILPLIPKQPQFRVKGIERAKVDGTTYMTGIGKDVKQILTRNEFAIVSEKLARRIKENITMTNGKASVKIGFAGFLQELGLTTVGEGGQISQIFNLGVDEFDQGGDGVAATTRESLEKIAMGVLQKQGVAGRIGETQLAMIQLAYARARAVDSNGRLSDNDFKIQMQAIAGVGLLQNTDIAIGKLEGVIAESVQMREETQFYVDMSTRQIGEKEAREFIAYERIVQPAKKIIRNQQASSLNVSGTVAAGNANNEAQALTMADLPELQDKRADKGVFYTKNTDTKVFYINSGDKKGYYVQDSNGYFYNVPTSDIDIK